MSRVDVVIPCYKYGHYLRQCVESVLSQEGVEVRVLILDDASPDNTPEVSAALMCEDKRVEYRRHAVNRGHIDTYNEGLLEWASGDYTLLLSADDFLAPGALGRAARVMDAHPEVGLVHGRVQVFETNLGAPATTPASSDPKVSIILGETFIANCCSNGFNRVSTPTAVVRLSLQHAVGGYRKALPHSGDMEMWLRLAARSAVAKIEIVQAFERVHSANMHHQYTERALGDTKERQEAFESFFSADGHLLANRQHLHALAIQGVAEVAFWAASRAFDLGDDSGCQQCLEYAARLSPTLPTTKEWTRLRWKRRLGYRSWSLLRPFVDRLRGRSTVIASQGYGNRPRTR